MRRSHGLLASALALAALGLVCAFNARAEDPTRGEYVFWAAGCTGCHTEKNGRGPLLAGGRALKTEFGTFYAPNITPDPKHGIGRWDEADFVRAVRHGVSPDGAPYYPAFPYPSFTKMTDSDLGALWSYLRTVPPASRANTPHRLRFPFRWRSLVRAWKWLYFRPGPIRFDPGADAQLRRGRYLVKALGHCGECHTPRTFLGGPKTQLTLAGTSNGPEGQVVPNLTPDPETGLGRWSASDVVELLGSGMTPDGDFVGGSMAEVVDDSTSRLTDADRRAIAAYLHSLPPIRHRVERGGRPP